MHAVGYPKFLQRLLAPQGLDGDLRLECLVVSLPHKLTLRLLPHSLEGAESPYLSSESCLKCWAHHILYQFDGKLLSPTKKMNDLLRNSQYRDWIHDAITYGILRYEEEFGSINYGYPHFKLYEQYTMRETALLSNYPKILSAFRGSGLIVNGKEFFLFVNLHKEADIREAINYKDQFITPRLFQWESPNTTSRKSERGQDLIYNYRRGVNLHLFARKFETIDNVIQPFTYFGKLICQNAENDRPILMHLALENEVPPDIFFELSTKV